MRRLRLESLILPAVALLVLAADQISKALVVARLALGQSVDLAPWLAPVFSITRTANTGASFGLFQGTSDILAIIAVAVVVVILLYYRQVPPGQWPLRAVLGLQLGGALGNLADRLTRGAVVDFIDVNFWPLRDWPIFNVADAAIVAGVALLGLMMVLERRGATRIPTDGGEQGGAGDAERGRTPCTE